MFEIQLDRHAPICLVKQYYQSFYLGQIIALATGFGSAFKYGFSSVGAGNSSSKKAVVSILNNHVTMT